MTSELAADLSDTFPGRMLIEWCRESYARTPEIGSARRYAESLDAEGYGGRVRMVLSTYLYGNDFKSVIGLDTAVADFVAMRDAVAAALSSPSRDTLRSPQHHHGSMTDWRTPDVANGKHPSALPDGAFWTATVYDDGRDSWASSGERDRSRGDRWYAVHFDTEDARIARIDCAADWHTLLDAHSYRYRGTAYPDWPSIADEYDAVHVSAAGLLCAQPRLTDVPYAPGDPSGYTHSQSGPYVGVGDWTVPSTAWLRRPSSLRVGEVDQTQYPLSGRSA